MLTSDWGDFVRGGDTVIRWVIHVGYSWAHRVSQLQLGHQLFQKLHSFVSSQVDHDTLYLQKQTYKITFMSYMDFSDSEIHVWYKGPTRPSCGNKNILLFDWLIKDDTHISQETRLTVDSRYADEEVEDDFEILRPAICQSGPYILNLWPCKLISILHTHTITHILGTYIFPATLCTMQNKHKY